LPARRIEPVQSSAFGLINWIRIWSSSAAWPLALVLAIAATFQNGISTPFLLDDDVIITDNESIRRLSPISAVLWPRTEVFTAGRPLLNLSFALNHALGGTDVRGYHIANTLIHALAALVLYGIVRRTLLLPHFGRRFAAMATPIAFATAALWALQPVQTQSVTYVSQRAESLMGLCYFFTLYAFVRAAERPGVPWAVASVASCFAGMLVKEVMVTAPVVILLYDRMFLAGSFRDAWNRRRTLHLSLAASWLLLLALMTSTRIHDRGVGYGFAFAWHEYLRIETGAILHYVRLALLPFRLVFDYGEQVDVPSGGVLAFFVIALALMILGTLMAFRRRHAAGFLGCWFLLILAPTSSVVPVAGQPIAENRLYLPLAAISVIIVVGTATALGRRGAVPLLAIGLGCAAMTATRNHVYRSELAIWSDTARKRPHSARARHYHGSALLRAGHVEEGIAELKAALQIQPTYSYAHANLGSAYFSQQRLEEAIHHLETAVRLNPNDPLARTNLGSALFHGGRAAEALQQYQEALRVRPRFAEAQVNLGIVLARLGRTSEALGVFEEAVRLHPHHRAAHDNLLQLRAALQPRLPETR
jgi:protein O-mannosyl-transferase